MKISAPLIAVRIIMALLLAALGEFCLFGFFASFEAGPGLNPWHIGYSLLGLSFFGGALWFGFSAFGLERKILRSGIVGLVLGGCAAFTLVLVMFMMGPRGDSGGIKMGVAYGALITPIGAAIGAALGITTSRFRFQTRTPLLLIEIVVLLLLIGFGFYSGWDRVSITFSVIFGTLLVVSVLSYRSASLSKKSLAEIWRMNPTKIEAYIETLPSEKRQKVVADLLAVAAADNEYISSLGPDIQQKYKALLEKLKHEQSG